MTLRSRLEQLERRLGSRSVRCDVCRDWPNMRTVEEGEDRLLDFAGRWGLHQPPERCPSCGWEPRTLVVRWVDYGDAYKPHRYEPEGEHVA